MLVRSQVYNKSHLWIDEQKSDRKCQTQHQNLRRPPSFFATPEPVSDPRRADLICRRCGPSWPSPQSGDRTSVSKRFRQTREAAIKALTSLKEPARDGLLCMVDQDGPSCRRNRLLRVRRQWVKAAKRGDNGLLETMRVDSLWNTVEQYPRQPAKGFKSLPHNEMGG